jgi:ribosomal protein L16 Arg81 hydroxylase
MKPLGLGEMTGAMAPEEFIAEHWLKETPVLLQPRAGLLAIAQHAPDVHALLAVHDYAVTLMGANSLRSVVAGRDAEAFLRQGYNLYVRGLERSVPALRDAVVQIAAELGFTRAQISIDAFAGSALSTWHYDHELNFQILLAGEKQWAMAKNASIENPLHANHLARDRQGRKKPEAFREETFLSTPIPTSFTPELSFRAQAGSVVFIPRGWWHEVQSFGECWCLNIVLTGASYAQVLAQALTARLHRTPAFRAYMTDLVATEAAFERVKAAAADALASVTLTEAQQVLRGDLYAWTGGATDEPLARALSKLEHHFTWDDARHLAPDMSAERVSELLAHLLAQGAITRR